MHTRRCSHLHRKITGIFSETLSAPSAIETKIVLPADDTITNGNSGLLSPLFQDHQVRDDVAALELRHVWLWPALVYIRMQILQAQDLQAVCAHSLKKTIVVDECDGNRRRYRRRICMLLRQTTFRAGSAGGRKDMLQWRSSKPCVWSHGRIASTIMTTRRNRSSPTISTSITTTPFIQISFAHFCRASGL